MALGAKSRRWCFAATTAKLILRKNAWTCLEIKNEAKVLLARVFDPLAHWLKIFFLRILCLLPKVAKIGAGFGLDFAANSFWNDRNFTAH